MVETSGDIPKPEQTPTIDLDPKRLFAAERERDETARNSILNRQEIKFEDINREATPLYNPILQPRSLDERRQYWEPKGLTYEDALGEWRNSFRSHVNQVADTSRISAIRSIMPEEDQELRTKDIANISGDDAMTLFGEYSANNHSQIDKFMRRAIKDVTSDGTIDLDALRNRIPHLKWIATGFFGEKTARTIGDQILLEAEAMNDWENARRRFDESPQPEPGQPGTPYPAPTNQDQMPPPVETRPPQPDDDDKDETPGATSDEEETGPQTGSQPKNPPEASSAQDGKPTNTGYVENPEQNVPRPQITINDFEGQIDYELLSGSSSGDENLTPRLDNTEATKGRVEMLLDKINLNAAFEDPNKTEEMVKEVEKHIQSVENRKNLRPDRQLTQKEISQIEAAGLLREFLTHAKAGSKQEALETLKRASEEQNQRLIVDTRQGLEGIFVIYNQTLGNVAFSFFELSEMMYQSSHEGKSYRSDKSRTQTEDDTQSN